MMRNLKATVIMEAMVIFCIVIVLLLAGLELRKTKVQVKALEAKVVALEAKEECTSKIEFDAFKSLASDEFVRNWKSFGIIRQNFVALGYGGRIMTDDNKATEQDACPYHPGLPEDNCPACEQEKEPGFFNHEGDN